MGKITARKPGGENDRGDTIVEVLLAIAVLGAVLGAAYVITNRSMITNRASQERLEAVKLAEAQFERIKVESAKENTTVFTADDFCMPKDTSSGAAIVQSTNVKCQVNANDEPVAADIYPRYQITIRNVDSPDLPSRPDAGARYRITVSWSDVRGDGTDKLDQFYEVYR